MPIITSIFNWINIKRISQIELNRKYPAEIQRDQLLKLIMQAKDTEWGRKYNYSEICDIESFQRRVPIQKYEDIRPWIERTRRGEQNIIWPSEIRWFAKSSGTTDDKSKFIPVSKENLEECHFRGGKDVMALYSYNFPETQVFSGKTLTLGGSHQIDTLNETSYFGDLSAILIQNMPFYANLIRTPSTEVALIPQWEEKLEKLTKEAIKEDVMALAGVPSWNLVMIKYILGYTGKSNLLEVWPNLELFIHGGVAFTPYREQFKRILPSNNMHYMETYNASEGFFGIQDDPNSPDMLLMLDYGIFYEFIPLENIDDENPPVYHIGEVKTGINYAMVISTSGGLWRYLIGDTIIFTSIFPHKIIISGRTRHFINAFGEELIIDNAEKALKIACEKTGALIHEYTAGPIYMGSNAQGSHEWLIEFDVEPADIELFTTLLDNALMALNSDYEAKRYKNITLGKPKVQIIKKGAFYEWFKNNGKLGGQNKMPRLSNNRRYIDEMNLINTNI